MLSAKRDTYLAFRSAAFKQQVKCVSWTDRIRVMSNTYRFSHHLPRKDPVSMVEVSVSVRGMSSQTDSFMNRSSRDDQKWRSHFVWFRKVAERCLICTVDVHEEQLDDREE